MIGYEYPAGLERIRTVRFADLESHDAARLFWSRMYVQ